MIVLINPFEVPADAPEDEFLRGWEKGAQYLRAQPGFVSATLHQAVAADARFRFINVAEWRSPGDFAAAVSSQGFHEVTRDNRAPNYPALYTVVRTVDALSSDVAADTFEGART